MKKLYFLLFSILPLITIAQGSINFDTDGNWSPAPSGYGNYTYTEGVFTATGVDVFRNGTTDQDGFPGGFDTYSVRLRNNASTSLTMIVSSGGIGNFSFQARRWDGSPATNFAVETTTDNGATWIASSTIDATVTTDSDWKTVNGVINSTNANVGVRIVSLGTTERIMVDNFTWTSPSSNPTLIISSPADSAVFAPTTTNVNVGLNVSNFSVDNPSNGDGYIVYNINGGGAVDKFDTTDISVPVTEGQSYTVNMELVDNSGNSLSTPVTASVSFSVDSYNVVTSIAEIRADVIANGTGKYYHLTSEAIVTYARPLANRNQKYIQDATAAILIDDNGGVITNTFNIGDGMTGFKGQTSSFSGVLQIIPMEDIAPNAPGYSITPEVVTVDDLVNDMTNNNYETYESELVKINGVTFADGNGSNTFTVNTNYDITDTNTMTFRSMFAEADYVVNADIIPVGATDIIVLAARFNTTPQVVARDLADVTMDTKAFNAIDGLKMYPNPVTGNTLYLASANNSEMSIQIFDILGKEVKNTKVMNNQVNISSLNAGVYIVKITEADKTATRKLIVR